MISPIGSGRAATSPRALAMSAMRCGVNRRRSKPASESPMFRRGGNVQLVCIAQGSRSFRLAAGRAAIEPSPLLAAGDQRQIGGSPLRLRCQAETVLLNIAHYAEKYPRRSPRSQRRFTCRLEPAGRFKEP